MKLDSSTPTHHAIRRAPSTQAADNSIAENAGPRLRSTTFCDGSKLPATYVATLRFRPPFVSEPTAPPDTQAVVPTAQVLVDQNLFQALLGSVFDDFHAQLPLGMGDKLHHPRELQNAILAFAANIDELRPGETAHQAALSFLKNMQRNFFRSPTLHQRLRDRAILGLSAIIPRLKERESDSAEVQCIKGAQALLQSMADGIPVSINAQYQYAAGLRAIAERNMASAASSVLNHASGVIRGQPTPQLAQEAADTLTEMAAHFRRHQADGPDVSNAKNALKVLERLREGAILTASEILVRQDQIKHLREAATYADMARDLNEVLSVLSVDAQVRQLQDKLLELQQCEAIIAIQNLSLVNRRTNVLIQQDCARTLPSALSIPQLRDDYRPVQLLREASTWLANRHLANHAREISGDFAQLQEHARQSVRDGNRLGDTMLIASAISSSEELLALANRSHLSTSGSRARTLHIWCMVVRNPKLPLQEKLALTQKLYITRKMQKPERLFEKISSGSLTLNDLGVALAAAVRLPFDTERSMLIRNEARQDWENLLLSRSLPASFGDIFIQADPLVSATRVNSAMSVASDRTARQAMEAALAANIPLQPLTLMQSAAKTRKQECIALLLQEPAFTDLPQNEREALLADCLDMAISDRRTRPIDTANHAHLLPVVLQLVNAGAHAGFRDDKGQSLIHIAASSVYPRVDETTDHSDDIGRQQALIRAVVARGVDVNSADQSGKTPLALRVARLVEAQSPALADPVYNTLRACGATLDEGIRQLEIVMETLSQNQVAPSEVAESHHLLMQALIQLQETERTSVVPHI
ncbi:ankyrin repeat domain-containing protein [Imbroritus primus]|uniref:Ankyrin repeat domain-containing protein n=1 Tax=Imbroritus primus TaxID=3058603 RepID=A0ACD3SRP8_9BURK|nr:ankyrin repeat domain-containing protein [Burkholderiaceae bacterium PBA]